MQYAPTKLYCFIQNKPIVMSMMKWKVEFFEFGQPNSKNLRSA